MNANGGTIEICEVGPRDGLQSEPRIWSVEERIKLIDKLSGTGVSRIEAVSFVNPKRVPQMGNAEAVMNGITRNDSITYAGLALNARGVDRAINAGVNEFRYVVVASETFNQKNQGATIDKTLEEYKTIANRVREVGIKLSNSNHPISTILWPSFTDSPVVSVSNTTSFIIHLHLKFCFLNFILPKKLYQQIYPFFQIRDENFQFFYFFF